jgi:hypothetical protein
MNKINKNNFEAYFLDFVEGNLNEEEKKEVMDFVKKNPEFAPLLKSYDPKMKVVPEKDLVFEEKHTLYHKTHIVFYKVITYSVSIAAIFLLLFFVGRGVFVKDNITKQEKIMAKQQDENQVIKNAQNKTKIYSNESKNYLNKTKRYFAKTTSKNKEAKKDENITIKTDSLLAENTKGTKDTADDIIVVFQPRKETQQQQQDSIPYKLLMIRNSQKSTVDEIAQTYKNIKSSYQELKEKAKNLLFASRN